MLATLGEVPRGGGWAFEWKWDGVRAVIAVSDGEVAAYSRNVRNITRTYPEAHALADLVDRPVLLDGELVTLDAKGRPDFGRLQSRMHVQRPTERLLREYPVYFYVFDVLHLDGTSLLNRPYLERRERLAELELEHPPGVRTSECYRDIDGDRLLGLAGEHGLEGIVAKRLDSGYQPGRRSPDWIKTPIRETQEVVIGGWAPGEGRRSGTIGALMLGVYEDGRLVFAGHVGTGFTQQALDALRQRLDPIARSSSPFDSDVPAEDARRARWVEPVLVGEVEHRQWTSDGRLRHPSWRGLRPDRTPDEVRRVS